MKLEKKQVPIYKRSKWGYLIFKEIIENKILKNRPTSRSSLSKLKDPISGKKISQKMLWQTLKILMEEEIIQEIPSKGKGIVYDLSEKFMKKEFNQLIYLDSLNNKNKFSDTDNFQHTLYPIPNFSKMPEYQQRTIINSIKKIDKELMIISKTIKISTKDMALVSTYPIKRTEEVLNNIELTLDQLFEEGLLFPKKNAKRLSIGNLNRMEQVILAGRFSCNTEWIKVDINRYKFSTHKELKKNFTHSEIRFMLLIIKKLINDYDNISSHELKKFIIYNGFNEHGLWYDSSKKNFYSIAEKVINSVKPEEYILKPKIERNEYIKNKISEYSLIPINTRPDIDDDYGRNELIIYIDAKIYFEKTRVMEQNIEMKLKDTILD